MYVIRIFGSMAVGCSRRDAMVVVVFEIAGHAGCRCIFQSHLSMFLFAAIFFMFLVGIRVCKLTDFVG